MKYPANKRKSVSKKTTPKIRGVRHREEKPTCCRSLDFSDEYVEFKEEEILNESDITPGSPRELSDNRFPWICERENVFIIGAQPESSAFDALFGTMLDLPDLSTRAYHRVQEVIDPFTVLGNIPFDFTSHSVVPNLMNDEEFNRLIEGF